MIAHINGTEIFFDIISSGYAVETTRLRPKPAIFVLHGGPGVDHSGYRPWLDDLGSQLQVVYIDHRGNGRSGRPGTSTYSIAQMAEDVDALRQHLGIDQIILFGHSFGGKVAQEYATSHPGNLALLILADTNAGAQFSTEAQEIAQRNATPEQLRVLGSLFRGEITSKEEWDSWWTTCLPLYFHRPDDETMAAIGARGVSAFEVANHMMANETPHFNSRPYLPLLTAPTLVMVGRHDWITPVSQSQEIAALIPGARLLILEDSGHMGYVEEPAVFIGAILDFVNEHLTKEPLSATSIRGISA